MSEARKEVAIDSEEALNSADVVQYLDEWMGGALTHVLAII